VSREIMMYPFMEWSIRTVESQLLVVLIPAMACDLASRYVICAKCDCRAESYGQTEHFALRAFPENETANYSSL
jgi:hypothetical protein